MKTATTDHRDFTAAPHERRWAGNRLRGLFLLLNQELETKPGGVYVWRILRDGAQVSLARVNGRRVLRVARSEPFSTPEGPQKFTAECETFLREFGCIGWQRQDEADAVGHAARFHEPLEPLL